MRFVSQVTVARVLALAILATPGCGGRAIDAGGTTGDAGQTGNVTTVPGELLPSDTGGGFETPLDESGVTPSSVGVMLSNVPNFCTALESGENPPNISFLMLFVTENGASNPAPPGTYAITTDPQAAVQVTATYGTQNDTCEITLNETATAGEITFTATGPDAITGSYDLAFPGGDHFTGGFRAPICLGIGLVAQDPGDASAPCRP